MRDKMAISAHILKIVETDPFLRLQMTAKSTNKQYIKIKPPNVTSVHYCGGCSVHWRLFSTSEG